MRALHSSSQDGAPGGGPAPEPVTGWDSRDAVEPGTWQHLAVGEKFMYRTVQSIKDAHELEAEWIKGEFKKLS